MKHTRKNRSIKNDSKKNDSKKNDSKKNDPKKNDPKKHDPKKNDQKVYEAKDYSSNDGMLTTVWGPGIWHYLHTMSFNYPVNPTSSDKKHYREFVLNLQYVLPCGKCRKNLVKNFKTLPLTMSIMESRDTFSKYIYDLHELVNHMLDKKSGLTYDNVRERYEHFRARCAKPFKQIVKCKKTNRTRKFNGIKDKGCVVPLYGNKAKCVLQIVPQEVKCETLQIDERCIKRKEVDGMK